MSATTSSAIAVSEIRVVIEAECSRCGPLSAHENAGLENIDAALAHTAATGHIVIFNGTVDRGDEE